MKLKRMAEDRAAWLHTDINHAQPTGDGNPIKGSDLLDGLASELDAAGGDPRLIAAARQRADWLRTGTPQDIHTQPNSHHAKFPLAGDCYAGPAMLWKLAEALR